MSGRRRLEFERPPLVWPRHRKINETLETVAARQASLDCRLDDIRAQGRRATASSGSNVRSCPLARRATQSLAWIGQKFVQPAMRVAKGLDEDRARVGAHRAGAGLCIAAPWMISRLR